MVCQIFFCSELPDIPDRLAGKREEGQEEHRQLQTVNAINKHQQILFSFKTLSEICID